MVAVGCVYELSCAVLLVGTDSTSQLVKLLGLSPPAICYLLGGILLVWEEKKMSEGLIS